MGNKGSKRGNKRGSKKGKKGNKRDRTKTEEKRKRNKRERVYKHPLRTFTPSYTFFAKQGRQETRDKRYAKSR